MELLFIVSIGRSGSTLLQRILNTLDDVRIEGENGLVLPMAAGYSLLRSGHKYALTGLPPSKRLFDSNNEVKTLTNIRTYVSDKIHGRVNSFSPGHPWFGIQNLEINQISGKIREFIVNDILRAESNSGIVGFKEIRWHQFPTCFEGLELLFPNAKYIFNYRDVNSVANSGWWKQYSDSIKVIQDADTLLKSEQMKLGEKAISVRYEDYIENKYSLAPLEDFIGRKFSWLQVENVLKIKLNH